MYMYILSLIQEQKFLIGLILMVPVYALESVRETKLTLNTVCCSVYIASITWVY